TEVWPFLAAGVPGINVSTFSPEFTRAEYHTQYDTSDRVDFEYLARLTRVCARLLLEADEHAEALLDFTARAGDLRRAVRGLDAGGLERALQALQRAQGRRQFTAVGRGLHGLEAKERAAYPHEQTRRDVERLEAALAALCGGRHRAAVRDLERVGLNPLCADLSHEAFLLERRTRGRRAPRASWAAQGAPDIGPDLWEELASLRSEPGARPPGPWLERSLERHLAASRRELRRRLARMERAVDGRIPPLPRVPRLWASAPAGLPPPLRAPLVARGRRACRGGASGAHPGGDTGGPRAASADRHRRPDHLGGVPQGGCGRAGRDRPAPDRVAWLLAAPH